MKNLRTKISILFMTIAMALIGFLIPSLVNNKIEAYALYSNDTSYYENFSSGTDLWNTSTKKFNVTPLKNLIGMLAKNSSATYESLYNTITSDNVHTSYNGDDWYATNVNKTANRWPRINLRGYYWIPCALYRNTDGDLCLTLWYWGYWSHAMMSNYNNASNGNYTYCDNQYSMSYMRAYYLANGGTYKSAYGNTTATGTASNTYTPWAYFTNSTYGLSDYISTPEKCNWQKKYTTFNSGYYNEYWETAYYSYSYDYTYAKKTNYQQWKTDKLWLPSLSETGWSGTHGLWSLDNIARRTYNSNSTGYYYWTRSTPGNYCAYQVVYYHGGNTTGYNNNSYCSIRPALHLNLTKAVGTIDTETTLGSTIFVDQTRGNNSFAGTTPTTAVKTIDNANSKVPNGGIVVVMNAVPITGSVTLGSASKRYTIRRWNGDTFIRSKYTGDIFQISNNATVTADYVTINGLEPVAQSRHIYINGGTLRLNANSAITGFNSAGTKNLIYLNSAASYVYIDGAQFTSNTTTNGLIYDNNGGQVTINTGNYNINSSFGANGRLFQGRILASKLVINNGTFTNGLLVNPSSPCTWTIHNGSFNSSGGVLSIGTNAQATITINAGTFNNVNVYSNGASSSVTVVNGNFSNNSNIYVNAASSSLSITTCTFQDGNIYASSTAPNSSMTVNNGTFTRVKMYADGQNGTFTIHTGTFSTAEIYANADNTTFLMNNGTYTNAKIYSNGGNSSIKINNGDYTNAEVYSNHTTCSYIINNGSFSNSVIYPNKSGSAITLNDGLFDEGTIVKAVADRTTLTIAGGHYTDNVSIFTNSSFGLLTINGGQFDNGTHVYSGNATSKIDINGGDFINNYANGTYHSVIYGRELEIAGAYFNKNKTPIVEGTPIDESVIDSIIRVADNGSLIMENCEFDDNTGIHGSCLYVNDNCVVSISGTTFTNNIGHVDGGIIYLSGNDTLSIYTSEFVDNYSISGGIIYVGENCTVNVNTSNFETNEAEEAGGIIYLAGQDELNVKASVFTENTAKIGGVIFGLSDLDITIDGGIFDSNTATASSIASVEGTDVELVGGGAIRLAGSRNVFVTKGNCEFVTNSTAYGSGGAISISGGLINANITYSEFDANTAPVDGGTIYIDGLNGENETSIVDIRNCVIENSIATFNGGAVYCPNTIASYYDTTFYKNKVTSEDSGFGGAVMGGNAYYCNFTENTALYGGAMYLVSGEEVDVQHTTFTSNVSRVGGAIFGLEENSIDISGSKFITNVANGEYVYEGVAVSGGGAVFIVGDDNVVYIYNSNFTKNKALVETGNGGALYLDGNQVVSLINASFEENVSSVNGGAVYLNITNSEVNYIIEASSSTFKNNTTTQKGGAVYCTDITKINYFRCKFINNKVTSETDGFGGAIYNGESSYSTFEGNISANQGGAAYKVDSYNSTFTKNKAKLGGAIADALVYDSTFRNNEASVAGGVLYNPRTIINSVFSKNKTNGAGGAVYLTDDSIIISNSQFKNNSADTNGGALYISIDGDDVATLEIVNSEFKENFAGEKGGALYNNGALQIGFKGEIEIVNNVAGEQGAGVYFVGSSTKAGSKITFGDTSYINDLNIFNNFIGTSVDSFERDEGRNLIGENQNNTFINFDNGNIDIKLAANVITGSKIGIVTQNFVNDLRKHGNDYMLLDFASATGTITQTSFNAFVSDDLDTAKFYINSIYSGATKTGVGIFIRIASITSGQIAYVASDFYGIYDGNAHGVDVQVFNPTSNYVVWYSTEENGEYTTDPIVAREAGDNLEVWFYIEAPGFTTTNKEKRIIKIEDTSQKDIYYDFYNLTIKLWIGQPLEVKTLGGTNINRFTETVIKDEEGNAVVCDFILYSSTNSREIISSDNVSERRELDIIPKNGEKYRTIRGLVVTASIGYENLYFRNNNFYPNEEEMFKGEDSIYKVNINNYNLSSIIRFLDNYGTVYFNGCYSEANTINVIIDKQVYFTRFSNNDVTYLGDIISVALGGNLSFSISNESKLTFKGLANEDFSSSAKALLSNNGTLNLIGSIYFEDVYNSNLNNNGGAVYSEGVLYVEGVTFDNCRATSQGGAIYAVGETTILNSIFDGCRSMVGGALYLSGSATIRNCLINKNYGANTYTGDTSFIKGAGVFVTGENSEISFASTRIINNTFNFVNMYSYGGGVYVESGNVEFLDCDIAYNTAYFGAGLVVGTGANVIGNNLRIEGNTLANGTVAYLNEGGGVYVEEEGEFSLNSGLIRGNGVDKESEGHNAYGLGIYVAGTFNFATANDTTTQLTLNSDTECDGYTGGGIYCTVDGVVNIYGGSVSQNYNSSIDIIIVLGTINIGGKTNFTSQVVYDGTKALVVVADDWSDLKTNGNFVIIINADYANTQTPVLVKGGSGFDPIYPQWEAISNRITVQTPIPSYINGERILSFDKDKHEYTIYYRSALSVGFDEFYFDPVNAASDLKDGTTTANAWKSWNGVLQKSKPGDTIYLMSEWVMEDFNNYDGEGRILKRYASYAGNMIRITGSWVPTINISNLIIDGNRDKGDPNNQFNLAGSAIIVVQNSCTLNLKNVSIKNGYNTNGVVYFIANDSNVVFSAIDCQFLNNATANNSPTSAVFNSAATNIDLKFYLFNSVISGNEKRTSSTNTWGGAVFNLTGTNNNFKTIDIGFYNCDILDNVIFNTAGNSTYGKLIVINAANYGANETIKVNIDGCNINGNKDITTLSKSDYNNNMNSAIYINTPTAFNFNFTNNNFNNNFGFYAAIYVKSSEALESVLRIEGNNFIGNEHFYRMIENRGIVRINLEDCYFDQATASSVTYFYAPSSMINVTNTHIYNAAAGIYVYEVANSIIINNFTYVGNGSGYAVYTDKDLGGAFYMKDANIRGAAAVACLRGISRGSTFINVNAENVYRGVSYVDNTTGNALFEDCTFINVGEYLIYSISVASNRREITARNVSAYNGATYGLRLTYTIFNGENVEIDNFSFGAYVTGGTLSGTTIKNGYGAIYVFNDANALNRFENVEIKNMCRYGVWYDTTAVQTGENIFINVKISDCNSYGFVEGTANSWTSNIKFSGCIIENNAYGYYKKTAGTAVTTQRIVFEDTIIRNNKYDGVYVSMEYTSNVTVTYSFIGSTISNNAAGGITVNKTFAGTEAYYPTFSFDDETLVTGNEIGFRNISTLTVAWIKIHGGKFNNNTGYGIYSSGAIELSGTTPDGVVAKNNGLLVKNEGETAVKYYNDVSATALYLGGKIDVGYAEAKVNNVFVISSLADSQTINIAVIDTTAVSGNTLVTGSGYTPNAIDLGKFAGTNWSLTVSGSTLVLGAVTTEYNAVPDIKTNVYYYNPKRLVDGLGQTPNDPITKWSQLEAKLNSNVTVYIMGELEMDESNVGMVDGHGATFKYFVRKETPTSPLTYFYENSMFKVIAGNVTIKNIVLDGNSNAYGYLSSTGAYSYNSVSSLTQPVNGALAYINGNSTLNMQNVYVTNFKCNNLITLEYGGNNLYVTNSRFKNIVTTTEAVIYSAGGVISITETSFDNISNKNVVKCYNNTSQTLTITKCNFTNCYNIVDFDGAIINASECVIRNIVTTAFNIVNSRDPESIIKDCLQVEKVGNFVLLGGSTANNYLTVENVNVKNCAGNVFHVGATNYTKTLMINDTTVRDSEYVVRVNRYSNITINRLTALNNDYVFIHQETNFVLQSVININDSLFDSNYYGLGLTFAYDGNALVGSSSINLRNTTIKNTANYAVYVFSTNDSNATEKKYTVNIDNCDITNNGGGIYASKLTLNVENSAIKGVLKGYSILFDKRHGCTLTLKNTEVTDNISSRAIQLQTDVANGAFNNTAIFNNCHFSKNKYGSIWCNGQTTFNIINTTIEESGGSPYMDPSDAGIYVPTSSIVNFSGLTIIEGGVFAALNSTNIRLNGLLAEGSHLRIYLNRQGVNGTSYTVMSGTDTSILSASLPYIKVDGWVPTVSGTNIVVSSINGNVRPTAIKALYFDPVYGKDGNNGLTYEYPLKTWQKVIEINRNINVPVYILNTWNVTEDTNVNGYNWRLMRCCEGPYPFTGIMFNVSNSAKLTINNLIIDGNYMGSTRGNESSPSQFNAISPLINAVAETIVILNGSTVQNAIGSGCNVAIETAGDLIAYNTEFSRLYPISASNNNVIHSVGNEERQVKFDGCKFTNSRNFSASSIVGNIIRVEGSNATIVVKDTTFENNISNNVYADGALISVVSTASTLSISGSKFINNSISYAYEMTTDVYVASVSCSVVISNTLFEENANKLAPVTTRDAGAVYIDTATTIEINNCEFVNCYAKKGAGIYITATTSSEDIDISINNVTFKNNIVGNGLGGAIYLDTSNFAGGKLEVKNVKCFYTFGNSAVHVKMNKADIEFDNVSIDGSNFSSTSIATNSGAIWVDSKDKSQISLSNITLKNTVTRNQNASQIESDNVETTITVDTLNFAGNTSDYSLFNIKGGEVVLANGSFTSNNVFSMLGFESNASVKVSDLVFESNLGGYSVYGTSNIAGNYELTDIDIINNTSTSGVYFGGNSYSDSYLVLNNIQVENNIKMKSAIFATTSNAEITNSDVTSNTTINSLVGGFNAKLAISNTNITYNTLVKEGREIDSSAFVSRGKDMFVEMAEQENYSSGAISILGGVATLDLVTVIGNNSCDYGGGIVSAAPIIITNSTISNNKSKTFGGGLVLTMDAEIYDSDITNNTSYNGGGIWFGGLLELSNVKVSGNISNNNGAAGYSYGTKAKLSVIDVEFINNTSYGNGGLYFVNDRGTVELHDVKFIANTGYGNGAALYLNSLTFIESTLVFSGNNVYGTLIHFENVSNFAMQDFVVSGNYGYGEQATLFSFTTASGNNNRMLFSNGRIYGNKMEYNASVVIDDGLYMKMNDVEVAGNTNLFSGTDISTSDNGKGGAIFVKNGTLVLEKGLAVDNWSEYGAWLFVGSKGKAIISNQEISNITTDAETIINGIIYVEQNGELELHRCKILGITLETLRGAINNSGHTLLIDSEISNNITTTSVIYNGSTGVINLDGVNLNANETEYGGVIYNLGAINLVSGKISNNVADYGGAIYNEGDVSVSGGEIIGNTAIRGGAIYNKGSVIISAGSISGNTASNSGAGIYNDEGSSLTMQGGKISLNTKTEDGSSIIGSGVASFGSIYLYSGEISNNGSTQTGNGGGLYLGAGSYNYVQNAVISNNLAAANASGANIYIDVDAYLYVKNSQIVSGRESSLNTIMDINVNEAILILDNTSLVSSVNSGVLRADDSSITILNSNIANLKPNASGSAIYISGGSLVINNSNFTGTTNTNQAMLYLDNLVSYSIENSKFEDNNARVIYLDVTTATTIGTISTSVFNGNTANESGAALYIKGSNSAKVDSSLDITETLFTNNTSNAYGGAIYIDASYGAVLTLYNTTFGGFNDANGDGYYDAGETILGNYAQSGGGAIYMANPASLVFKGDVIIDYNATKGANGGGLYYNFTSQTDYDNNRYGLSLQSGAKVVIKYNYANANSVTEMARATENNLYLTTDSNKGVLVAELSSESAIGITLENQVDGEVAITSYKADIPVTTNDMNVFSYDNIEYSLKLDTTENAIVLKKAPTDRTNLIVHISDMVYTLDGNAKTITESDFTIYNSRNYTITYATEEDGEYSATAPNYYLKGEHTIWYKVVDNTNPDKQASGSVILKITGKILSIVEAPIAYLSSGEKLSNAKFEYGLVKSGETIISGTWAFKDANVTPTNVSTRYQLIFTPSDPTLYENTVSILVNPTIEFSKVYYFADGFYNDVNKTSYTGIKTLSTMVSHLKELGEIFFMETYVVGSNGALEETITTNKKIYLARYLTFTNAPIIELPRSEDKLKLSLGGGSGSIYIDCARGGASNTETSPLFVNSGLLSLGNNVYIRNISNTGGGPAVAHNTDTGVLNLNGCDIYSTFVDINIAILHGGAIYNQGVMVINGGDYRLNYCTYGNGGFIYNTGNLTINSGLFARNYSTNGSGGCIYTSGGSVTFNGGDFIGNKGIYGGVVCVNDKAQVVLNGANFYSNIASQDGASIYNVDGIVVQNGGDFKYNVNLALNSNSKVEDGNKNSSLAYVAILAVIGAIVVASLVTTLVIKLKRKTFKTRA